LTKDGIAGRFRAIWLKHPYVQSNFVTLHPGWPGLFDYELKRIVDANLRDDSGTSPAWNDDLDPEFRILDGELSKTARTTGMRPILLIPKSGEHIIFLCWDEARRPSEVAIDPVCDVRDMVGGPEQDQLKYQLYRSQLKNWRQYSNWLWNFLDSITVRGSGDE
jgi:hypothetical protein